MRRILTISSTSMEQSKRGDEAATVRTGICFAPPSLSSSSSGKEMKILPPWTAQPYYSLPLDGGG
jgi:hypothetical protein